MAEAERSLHDAIMIVKRVLDTTTIVGGGGAIEMELSYHMKKYARSIQTKLQPVIEAFATSLEVIPKQLAENAGYNPMDVLNVLRANHSKGRKWDGINIEDSSVFDTVEQYIWEPSLMKLNALAAATEAACLLLSVDETIKAPANESIDDRRIQGQATA
uniref:T-complex protein 1 subunit eta n=1 Tax=Lygus hesperus TaxID=30085 RepID=A0A0A9Z716_LYGHE